MPSMCIARGWRDCPREERQTGSEGLGKSDVSGTRQVIAPQLRVLEEAGIPYGSGVARFEDLARGRMLGDRDGLLKLLVHQKDRRVLGVHCVGTSATELIHIGQMVMAFNGTVNDLVDNVFNYPTLAEAYKVAAHNAVNKLERR